LQVLLRFSQAVQSKKEEPTMTAIAETLKPTAGLTIARPLILAITTISLTACATFQASESVVATRTLGDRQACAQALADSDISQARATCLNALEALAAGFGE
jgi:hypothetical protein